MRVEIKLSAKIISKKLWSEDGAILVSSAIPSQICVEKDSQNNKSKVFSDNARKDRDKVLQQLRLRTALTYLCTVH